MSKSENPEGWAYNPSAWSQRLPIAGIGLFAGLIALYLWARQRLWIPTVWDPFGSHNTETVLFSPISGLWPIHDAFLGALGYLSETVTSLIGGKERFRTMPWFVFIFSLTCIPFTFFATCLFFFMPTILEHWCFLCVITTICSWILTPFAWDEVWAAFLEVRRQRRNGASLFAALSGRAGRQEKAERERRKMEVAA